MRAERISASNGTVRVHLAANGLDHARLGFTIPRAAGGAVVRNRIRRRLRALLQPRLERLAGLDVIVSAGPPAAAVPFAQLEADLSAALERALALVSRRSRSAAPPPLSENGTTITPGPRRALAPTAS